MKVGILIREGPEVLAKMDMRFGSEGRVRNVDEFSISSLLSQFREFLQLEFRSSPGLVAHTTLSHGLRSRSEIGLIRYSRTSKPDISESFPPLIDFLSLPPTFRCRRPSYVQSQIERLWSPSRFQQANFDLCQLSKTARYSRRSARALCGNKQEVGLRVCELEDEVRFQAQ